MLDSGQSLFIAISVLLITLQVGINHLQLRNKSKEELESELLNLKKEAFNLRFQASSGQLENTSRIRYVRRNIARIKTLLIEENILVDNQMERNNA